MPATRRINVMDAIDEHATMAARSRTAIVRIGTVTANSVANSVQVSVGGATFTASCFQPLITGDVVELLYDTDAWWVLNKFGGTTLTYTALTVPGGWTGSVEYALRSGFVHLYVNLANASWTTNAIVATLPVGARPAKTLYFAAIAVNTAAPLSMRVISNGDVGITLASTTQGGVLGSIVYPAVTT